MSRLNGIAYLAVLALLSGTLYALHLSEHRAADVLEAPLETVRSSLAGWTITESATLTPGEMGAVRPTSYLIRGYGKEADRMAVFVAYYAVQQAGETMHSPKSCLPGAGWEIWNSATQEISFEGRSVPIRRYSIRNADQRMAVLYWYQSRHQIFSDEYLGKFILVRDALFKGRTSGTLVRITLADDPRLMREGLSFAQELMGEVQRCVGR